MKEEGLEGNVIVQEQGLNLSNGTGAARKFEEEKRRWGGQDLVRLPGCWCVVLKWWPGGLKSRKIGGLSGSVLEDCRSFQHKVEM